MAKKSKKPLQETAKQLAKDLAKTLAENDPVKERAYLAREAEREAKVTEALKVHLAKRKR